MKKNDYLTLIILVIGLAIVAAGTILILMQGTPAEVPVVSPTAKPLPVKADVFENIDTLSGRVNASGLWFGGASLQSINGDDTAMVYVYRPVVNPDATGLLAPAFTAIYSIFEDYDPLLVGLVDTTQKISDSQYKVDVYALERSIIGEYIAGNLTNAELIKKAILVTPETESLRSGESPAIIKKYINPNMTPVARNYTPPTDREAYANDLLNRSGYKPLKVVSGELEGKEAVMMALQLDPNTTCMDRYNEIEAALRACAGAYGDYDRYMITMMAPDFSDYVTIDTGAGQVLDYMDSALSQWQLYRMINLTYYTK